MSRQLPDIKSLRKKAGQFSQGSPSSLSESLRQSRTAVGTIPESTSEDNNSSSALPKHSSDSESDEEFLSRLKEENKELEHQLRTGPDEATVRSEKGGSPDTKSATSAVRVSFASG